MKIWLLELQKQDGTWYDRPVAVTVVSETENAARQFCCLQKIDDEYSGKFLDSAYWSCIEVTLTRQQIILVDVHEA